MKQILAIDTGGTKITCAVINENGEFLTEIEKFQTPKKIDELIKLFKDIITRKKH